MEFRPPVTLEGRFVRLIPLEMAHCEALAEAGNDAEIWRFLRYGPRLTVAAMRELITTLLAYQSAGTDLAFTVQARIAGTPVGMTRYLAIDRANDAVEIGGTWLSSGYRRTPINTEAKRLLLAHAFETEGAHRVQLRTDLRNERSQRAIERLGATREGVLRESIRMPDGYRRSSVCYSILADEWPSIRARLDRLLERPWVDPTSSQGSSGVASP